MTARLIPPAAITLVPPADAFGRAFSSHEPGVYAVNPDPITGHFPVVPATNNVQVYVKSNWAPQIDPLVPQAGAGSDVNDGLSPTTPLLTIGEVYRKFPAHALDGRKVVINLAGTSAGNPALNGFFSDAADFLTYHTRTAFLGGGEAGRSTYQFRGPRMVLAQLQTGTNAPDNFFAIGALSATNQSQVLFDDHGPPVNWTAHSMKRLFLRVTRGGANVPVIWEVPITDNGTDRLFIDWGPLGVGNVHFLATDTFEIVNPGAQLATGLPGADPGVAIIGNNCYTEGARIQGQTQDLSHAFTGLQIEQAYTMGVEGLSFDRCSFYDGARFRGGTTRMHNCIAVGPVYWETGSGMLPESVQDEPAAVSWLNLPADDAAQPGIVPVNAGAGVDIVLQGDFNPGTVTLYVGNEEHPGTMHFFKSLAVWQNDNAQGAVLVNGPGSWLIMNNNAWLNGNGTAGPGLHCINGGQARVYTQLGQAVITGAAGDLKVGSGAVVPYADFDNPLIWNRNLVRFNPVAIPPTGDTSRIYQ